LVDITYDAGTNTIRVIGGTSEVPHTPFDVYDADFAGGWGKVTVQGTSQFRLTCKLMIGDENTATYFAAEAAQIVFANGIVTGSGQAVLDMTANAHVRFGVVADVATKTTTKGCAVFFLESTYYMTCFNPISGFNASLELYGCMFYGNQDILIGNSPTLSLCRVWNCTVTNQTAKTNGPHFRSMTGADVFNINCLGSSTVARQFKASTKADRLFAVGASYGVWFQTSAGILKNVYGRNLNYAARMEAVSADCYIINADFTTWHIQWTGGASSGRLIRQYEFDLKAVDNQNSGAPLEGVRFRVFRNGVEVTKTGSGYTTVPSVTIGAPPQGGTQATAHAVLDPNGQGQIAEFVVDNPGSGYITAPTVTVDAPSSGVVATALASIIDGVVSALTPTAYTDSSGSIPTRCITKCYYNQANGDTAQDDSALTILLTKDGYVDYRDQLSLVTKTGFQVSLNRTQPVLVGVGGKLQVDLMPTNPVNVMLIDVG
jgi:hypothetical protein